MEVAVPYQAYLRYLFSGACLWALCSVALAQPNPLAEHRRSAIDGVQMKPVVEVSYVANVDAGRATLGTPSARLIDAGLKSGDPMIVVLGTMSVRVHVAFRDELERAAQYFAETQDPGSLDLRPSLVIDREDSALPVVLEPSMGDASLYLSVQPGSRVTLRWARERNPGPPRAGATP
jgi:hypothetical protein